MRAVVFADGGRVRVADVPEPIVERLDARDALIALLHALRCEDKIVDPGQYGLSKRELRARAEEVAKGNWASEAVRRAIDEMMAAVAAASAAATAATSG